MCRVDGACNLVQSVVEAVSLPVTVKMRLGWDRERITAPALAREFEQIGVAAITIHGRTRQQGFRGAVRIEGIRAVVEAVERIPVVGNGDVKTVADAWRMLDETGCAAVAIGRGALLDPWLFRRLERAEPFRREGRPLSELQPWEPEPSEQFAFLRQHFAGMVAQHGEFQSCLQFRKFAAWYGARLGCRRTWKTDSAASRASPNSRLWLRSSKRGTANGPTHAPPWRSAFPTDRSSTGSA